MKSDIYLGDHRKGEIEIEKENPVFSNRFMTLYDDFVIFPNGQKGTYIRESWNAPYGVMVVPINEDGKLMLVRNFRHHTRRWGWEIVKGFGVEDLSPIECVNKELEEEIGLIAEDIQIIKEFPDNGLITSLFVAKSLKDGVECREYGEAISDVKSFSKKECLELMANDDCHDILTLFSLSLFVSGQLD
ncbi:NUDIX hydrolase [Vibrio parahaemolyticus]|uniref:NUDIX hydrolase n=1 Tax=Vibrio parahaemolyticus TaxID=670 RepID=UPI001F4D8BA7|nr:NUDIX hydrolase [Vibrio parahaemolyticus]